MADRKHQTNLHRRSFLIAAASAALHPQKAHAAVPTASQLRLAVGSPAAGVAYRKNGHTTLSVSGQRAIGHAAPVQESDLWHLGSLTKSMTAMLAAKLIEQGAIRFDTTLGSLFDGAGDTLADATLAQLLHHRSGMRANISNDVAIDLQKMESNTPAPDIRLAYLTAALSSTGGGAGEFLYSNAGYVAATAMLEIATGEPWEDLIQIQLFSPLGLTTAGFGPPGFSTASPDQPWGHAKERGKTRAYSPTQTADNILALNPAGRVHMSLTDFLVYLTAHADRSAFLDRKSWRQIHQPVSDANARYAMGWVAPTNSVRMHSGSNTIWFATGGFNDQGDAIAMVVNIGVGANLPAPVELPVLDFLKDV